MGGGSVLDCCKMISAQAKTDEDIWKMEFEDKKLPTEFVKLASVVTASGTGAEMNNVSIRSELMWDSSIAESGLLKLGKITDFQAHQILHKDIMANIFL